MSELCETALRTRERLKTIYFKILPKDGGWSIIQHVGPVKTPTTMSKEGWARHAYLINYISNDYPVFYLNDFISKNGVLIEKKSKEDMLKEEINEYIEMLSINKRISLCYKGVEDICFKCVAEFS